MKTFQWPFRALLVICLAQIISCTKQVDTLTEDSVSLQSSSDATVANEFSNCKLRRIVHEHGGIAGRNVSGLFTYNAAGNPYSLTYTEGNLAAWNPNYYFFYDNKNRLRELRSGPSPTDTTPNTERHKYGYDINDRIVVDTLLNRFFGYQDDNGTYIYPEIIWSISQITYDAEGRIIKESAYYPNSNELRQPTYTYDNRGNVAVKGWKSSWYDNKVSFLRTHPIFMFLMRNYSKNNAYNESGTGRKYNSRGLPLSMKPSNDPFFNAHPSDFGFNFAGGISQLVYDCQ